MSRMQNGAGIPMQTITAPSFDKCRSKLDTLFGEGQYMIHSKKQVLSGGFFGLGQKECVECKYTVKNPVSTEPKGVANDDDGDDLRVSRPRSASIPIRPRLDEYSSFQKNQADILRIAPALAKMQSAPIDSRRIDDQLKEISSQLQKITAAGGYQETHPTIKKIEDLLSDNEFNLPYIRDTADKIRNTFSLGELDDYDKVERKVIEWIGQSIQIADEKEDSKKLPKTVVIVGPTGVGKTTSLIKLASKLVVQARNSGKSDPIIEFVTIDSMRVGALEQISRFGDIFNTKALKAESVTELQSLYESSKDKVDAFFIDTSGYSPNDADRIGKMKALLQIEGFSPDIYLAVTASTKSRDIENIMENYALFHYKSIIVTKMDESMQFGNIISVCAQKKKSISYVADAQSISQGIHKATADEFIKHLLGFKADGFKSVSKSISEVTPQGAPNAYQIVHDKE